jgi:serine/threonine protein phosphatase PrpC
MDIHIISEKGGRSYMEDTHFLEKEFGSNPDWTFGGIFDGHGGARVAILAARELPGMFLEKIKARQGVEKAFKNAFNEISKMEDFPDVGCTALSFFIKRNMMWVANAGDGRMIKISPKSTEQITRDHRIDNPEELKRVLSKGATIQGPYVMHGDIGLMPTRSLGDHILKEVGITSEPEIFKIEIPKNGANFIAGTDGIWDVISNEQATDIVKKARTAKQAAERLQKNIFESNPRHLDLDNITFMVIRAHPKK